ncbi:hypothetical protein DH09_04425 [Bacillaceae bacterium JMAK1]|nr:hypothetical protein DH09_04425 [Bacillaceae bacterium JMAK1]
MSMKNVLETILFPKTRLHERQVEQRIHNKTIVITGASSGIGKEIALKFANITCQLVLVARNRERLDDVKRLIERKQKAKVSVYSLDLRDEAERICFLQAIHEENESIDLFVSNAGLSIRRSIYQSLDRLHDVQRTININYEAPVAIVMSLLPLLEKNGGQIVNVSTINCQLPPMAHFSAYQASKSAFDTWLRSVTPEIRKRGVNVTSIYLPLVRTQMIAPTKQYNRMPAMSPEQAAIKVINATMKQKARFEPWWLKFAKLYSSRKVSM